MAWQPCLVCDQRFNGEACNAYLMIPWGDKCERYRFVVCEPCLDELAKTWRMRALYRGEGGEWSYREPTTSPEPILGPSEPRETQSRGPRAPREARGLKGGSARS